MKISTTAMPIALGLALFYAAAPMVHAEEAGVVGEANHPIEFMTGGIGKGEAAAMRKAGKDFNLRVEFSERQDNEFVADANLAITDTQGHVVFAELGADPIVNLNLPDGHYRVSADFHGQTETRFIKVHGKAVEDLYFHWKGNAE